MITIRLLGLAALQHKLRRGHSDVVDNFIQQATLKYEGDVKMATVVRAGALRSSIGSKVYGNEGRVSTSVPYAQFVEFGTSRMEARHMEGPAKVLGEGMFAYTTGQFRKWMREAMRALARRVEDHYEH